MRTFLCLIVLTQAILVGSAQAEMPMPTCAQMKAGYDAITSKPISASDGTLSIAVNAFADNKLLAHDQSRQRYATRERIASHLATLKPMDALLWVGQQFDVLETALQKNKCEYEHHDIHLMLPQLPPNSCKQTGPLPDKLLDK